MADEPASETLETFTTQEHSESVMADEPASETLETSTLQDMELEPEATEPTSDTSDNGGGGSKRARDEEEEENGVKKPKVEGESFEEQRLDNLKDKAELGPAPVSIGPKTFESSLQMFNYFIKFLHDWPPNVDVNKYEHIMLLELLKKGHPEPERKIGTGIRAFQVRYHPQFRSSCFFLVRDDESADDFSFRKCVDHILPLPENVQVKHEVQKELRGGGKGGKGGRGRRQQSVFS